MFATTKELGAIKGISEAKVTKLKEMGGCSLLRYGVVGAGCCRLTQRGARFINAWCLPV